MPPELLLQFLNDPAWDAPFFKRLAPNDTANAPGHQGGMAVPIALRPYLPALDEDLASAAEPTVERQIVAEMFIPGRQLGRAVVRYQYQTWTGKRSAEGRLTKNLGPLRRLAFGDDLLILQRSRDRLDTFRLLLIRSTDAAFPAFVTLTQGQRWGALFAERAPVSQPEVAAARALMLAEAAAPFVPIRDDVPRVPTTRLAIARDTAFRDTVVRQYQERCAVSGIALTTGERHEAQAAHIIPLERGGADEPRNGLTLTATLHWAFDRGLFGVGDDRRVIVPPRVRATPNNAWLVQFHNQAIAEPQFAALRPAPAALAWHRKTLLARRPA